MSGGKKSIIKNTGPKALKIIIIIIIIIIIDRD